MLYIKTFQLLINFKLGNSVSPAYYMKKILKKHLKQARLKRNISLENLGCQLDNRLGFRITNPKGTVRFVALQ